MLAICSEGRRGGGTNQVYNIPTHRRSLVMFVNIGCAGTNHSLSYLRGRARNDVGIVLTS
jgi:hypothetical protein